MNEAAVELARDYFSGGDVPLVILHGLYGSKRNWRTAAKKLSSTAHVDVYSLDLRHHGESPNKGGFSLKALASDVLAFIDSRIRVPAIILGHSIGGKIGLQAALACPEKTAGLILADISPFDLPEHVCGELRSITDALTGLSLSRLTDRREAEAILSKNIPDTRIVRFLLQSLVRNTGPSGPSYRWQIGIDAVKEGFDEVCRGVLPQTILPEQLAVREMPLLCIRGGSSPFFPENHIHRLRTVFPLLEARTVENAGHWLHVEKQDEFIGMVGDFIRRHGFSS